jgi:hypothetical protein
MLMLAALLSACAAFNAEDVPATMAAERVAFATEAVMISALDLDARTRSAATVAAAEATIAVVSGVNIQLLATLQRNVTPTPVLDTQQQIDARQAAEFEGRRLFVKTGVGDTVDPDTGCILTPSLTFPVSGRQIYATARAFNIEAGTPLSARWYYENELVYEFDFTTTRGYADWCFWFDIRPDIVEFRPGSWSVRLYADGFQLEEPMPFSMIADSMPEAMPGG